MGSYFFLKEHTYKTTIYIYIYIYIYIFKTTLQHIYTFLLYAGWRILQELAACDVTGKGGVSLCGRESSQLLVSNIKIYAARLHVLLAGESRNVWGERQAAGGGQ